jgi:hypothetical protein
MAAKKLFKSQLTLTSQSSLNQATEFESVAHVRPKPGVIEQGAHARAEGN